MSRGATNRPRRLTPAAVGVVDEAAEATGPAADDATPAVVLVAVMGAVAFAQGGYHRWGQLVLAIGTVALALTAAKRPTRLGRPAAAGTAAVVLGGWILLAGATTGTLRPALGPVAALVAMAVAFTAARRLDVAQARVVTTGLTVIGVAAAIAGWAGVAWHVEPLALPTPSMWRAAMPVTYANASAALLGAVALVACAERAAAQRRDDWHRRVAVAGLLAGVVATGSRAGLLALAVGLVVLASTRGARAMVDSLVQPGLAALVVVAGLAPSMFGATAAPLPAVAGALCGVGVAAAPPVRLSSRVRAVLGVAALVLVAVVGVVAMRTAGDLVDTWSTSTSQRAHAWRAAIDHVGAEPLVGAGVGAADLTWTAPSGATAVIRYAHNEYLQAAAEVGLIGLMLVAALLAAVVAAVRGAPASGRRAGALAALAAFALHSAFDFLWHVPAVPLVIAVVAGLAMASNPVQTPDRQEMDR